MLTYDAALERILQECPVRADVSPSRMVQTVPLLSALAPGRRISSEFVECAMGRVLAQDIYATTDLPPFDNSAVDGYAVNGVREAEFVWPVVQTIPAGSAPQLPLSEGEATRIYTGAPVPVGTTGIVMVEDSEPVDDGTRVRLRAGTHCEWVGSAKFIRRRGSDIAQGTLAVPQGTPVTAAVVGLLSALNISDVPVYPLPRVALLTSGDEVVPAGSGELALGQIRDANGPALAAAITATGAELVHWQHIPDDPEATHRAFAACHNVDVIVTSGGVSVGDHDYIRTVVESLGTLNFWRIAIKPGKPLAFGKIGDALFFGLPGNPVSSLVTWELFVRPVLRKLAGHSDVLRPLVSATLTATLSHEPGRREFVRARVEWRENGYRATPTGMQGSHRLTSLLDANALLVAHEDHADYNAGDTLPALLLL